MSEPNWELIARNLERVAGNLRTYGHDGWRKSRDWATTPSTSAGNLGHGGGVADPTASAARKPDQMRESFVRLRQSIDVGHDALLEAERIILSTRPIAADKRASIGMCACGTYCDGVGENRLKNDECPACYMRTYRERVTTRSRK